MRTSEMADRFLGVFGLDRGLEFSDAGTVDKIDRFCGHEIDDVKGTSGSEEMEVLDVFGSAGVSSTGFIGLPKLLSFLGALWASSINMRLIAFEAHCVSWAASSFENSAR